MKKLTLLLAVLICLPFIMNAQSVEVTPFGGYVFGGTMNGDYGDVHINDNAQYGGMISLAVSRVMDVDLIYNRSDTKAQVNYFSINGYVKPYVEVPLSINYMQIGFTKNFRVNPKVSPFVGFNIGACAFAPKEEYSDAWFFSVGMNAGAKVYFSNRVGLRLQAQGYMPVQGTAFSMFVGTGGASTGVSVYSTLFQFGFTGGLIFRLGRIQ
ncbi:MAG: DUF2715 domain-containing protein [Bacteroidetes bacterium]|nr:DUF2715 domain-containing protein [Bacteroidota bacterium]